jgi:hypothetical protein
MRILIAIIVALSVSLGLPSTSQAEQDTAAEVAHKQANAYFKVGAFQEAAMEFIAAFKLDAKATRLFNAGRAFEEAAMPQAASAVYGRFIEMGAFGETTIEAKARKLVIDKQLAISNERDPAQEIGALLGEEPPVEEPPAEEPLPGEPDPPAPAATNSYTAPTKVYRYKRGDKSREKWAIGFGAVGVVGLGASAYFFLSAWSDKSDLDDAGIDACNGGQSICSPSGLASYNDASSKANTATIAVGVGAAAGLIGIYLWKTADTRGSSTAVRVHPSLGSQSVGLVLDGSY